jgi:hypothetical protein
MFKRKNKAAEVAPLTVPAAYILTDEQNEALATLEADTNGMVRLGDLTRRVLGEQVQYISYHFTGTAGRKVLTEGLRVDASSFSYHEYRIHIEDCHEFIARLRTHRHQTNQRSL